MFSFGLNSTDVKKIVWTGLQAFVGAFIATAQGWGAIPNLDTAKAAAVSAAIAAGAAVISLIKNLVLGDGSAIK